MACILGVVSVWSTGQQVSWRGQSSVHYSLVITHSMVNNGGTFVHERVCGCKMKNQQQKVTGTSPA